MRRLLLKYNGKFEDYRDWEESVARRMRREAEASLSFKINWDEHGGEVTKDVDKRCREVQKEIDRAAHNSNPTMWSSVLRGTEQSFPTRVLRVALEQELDSLLREQVYERQLRGLRSSTPTTTAGGGGDGGDGDDDEGATSSDEADAEEEEAGQDGVPREGALRGGEARGAGGGKVKEWTMDEDKFKERQWVAPSVKGPDAMLARAERIAVKDEATGEEEVMGPDYCRACRSQQCRWAASCDVASIVNRRRCSRMRCSTSAVTGTPASSSPTCPWRRCAAATPSTSARTCSRPWWTRTSF